METPPKPQVLKRISGMYFWEMDPVAHLPTGDGGLLLGFLFCKPSNFELKGPHPLQLCVIRSVFLIGMVELLDYCKESGSNPNQVTIKPQIPGLGSVFFFVCFFFFSHAEEVSMWIPTGILLTADFVQWQTYSETEREHECTHNKSLWQMSVNGWRTIRAQIPFCCLYLKEHQFKY